LLLTRQLTEPEPANISNIVSELEEVLMSSFTLTIEGTTAETENTFLMHVVQAALKAYRHHRNTSDHVNENDPDHGMNGAETTIQTRSIHLVTR
jgi:hypothetical protein